MSEFKKGSRVIYVGYLPRVTKGSVGTVLKITKSNSASVAVQFDGQSAACFCFPESLLPLGTPDPKAESASDRGAGLKFDGGKPRWSLLMQGCHSALNGVAEVLTFGAKKYAAHSWQQVENNKERYRDAMYRHLNAIERGEVLDPESGLPHWDHVACNALFLSELNKGA
jgi:hypothetical protein